MLHFQETSVPVQPITSTELDLKQNKTKTSSETFVWDKRITLVLIQPYHSEPPTEHPSRAFYNKPHWHRPAEPRQNSRDKGFMAGPKKGKLD